MIALRRQGRWADQLAICLSGLCMLHCFAGPILALLLPVLSVFEAYESWIHRGLILIVAPVSVWALWRGCAQHGRRRALSLGLLALLVLGVTPFLGHQAHDWELPLTMLGSFTLIASHMLNLRYLRPCGLPTQANA